MIGKCRGKMNEDGSFDVVDCRRGQDGNVTLEKIGTAPASDGVPLDRAKTLSFLRMQIAKMHEAERQSGLDRVFDRADNRGRRLALLDVVQFIEHGFLDAAKGAT